MKKLTAGAVALLGLILLLSGVPLSAQTPDLPTGRPLSLKERIDYALAHHNNVRAAERNLDGSKAGIKSAKAGYMPKVTANSDYSNSGITGNYRNNDPGGNGNDSNGMSTSIGIKETLYDGGKTSTSIRQAQAQTRMSEADLESTRQQCVLDVTTAYFEVLRTKRLAEIAAETVKESEQQVEMIVARIDAGDAANIDRYPAEVQLANAKLKVLRAKNDARVAANTLRNAIGLDRGPELALVDVQEPPGDALPLLDDCLAAAVKDRPEMARNGAQLDSAKAALRLAKLQRLPIPTISAGFDRGISGMNYDNQWSVGVGVSMNIFDGGAAAAQEESGKASVDSTTLKTDQLTKDISMEVEQAYLNSTNALERLAASRPNVVAAKQNLDAAREKYTQQLGIPLEIVTAQLSYETALTSEAEALYDSYIARAQLDKAIGKRGY